MRKIIDENPAQRVSGAKMATKSDKRQLNIPQENAIDLLIQGKSDREVSEIISVHRSSINQWQNHHAVFIAELNRRRKEIWGSQSDRLRNLIEKAVDVLEDGLSSEDDKIRLDAAIHVLKAVKLYGASQYPTGKIDPKAIEKGWELDKVVSATFPIR